MLPLAPLLVASQLFAIVSDPVPLLNVRPSCGAAKRTGDAVKDLNDCLHGEQLARVQLIKDWDHYAAADRSDCVQLSVAGGSPSYVELLTCLEMAQAAKESPDELGAAQRMNRPRGSGSNRDELE
jgi:hypothetical protein